jgi:microsomal dipeptidase-like Zn-dependent dipeptidase
MHRTCAEHPDEIELARTVSDIRRLKAAGKLAAVLCVEGGHSIDDDLAVLRDYHQLDVRHMTLTWNNTNNWADGILDEARHNGLTEFGREVVREMDRLGCHGGRVPRLGEDLLGRPGNDFKPRSGIPLLLHGDLCAPAKSER